MTYPCEMTDSHASWIAEGKLDHLHLQSHLQTQHTATLIKHSCGQSDRGGNQNRGLLHDTVLSLPLRSIFATVPGCLQWHRNCAKLATCGAAQRKALPELDPALHSTEPCLLALQKALETPHGWSGWQRHLCKAKHATHTTHPDPHPPFSSAKGVRRHTSLGNNMKT